jgi:hypothetical protein
MLELQRAYYQGEIPREAAMASASLVYGFTPAEAEKLFPPAIPVVPTRPWGGITATVVGAIVGLVGGGLVCESLSRGSWGHGPLVPREWQGLAMFTGIVGGALLGGLLGPLVRLGMVSVWRRYAESP